MKKCLATALLLAAILCLTAAASLAAEGREKLRLVYYPTDFLLDVDVALEKGFFDQAGLDVEPMDVKGGGSVYLPMLMRGEIDACFTSSFSALTAIDKGIKLVQVCGVGNRPFTYYALKDSPVNSIKDFSGHVVANKPKPDGPWLALTYDLDKFKVTPKIIDMRDDTDRVTALISGQVEIISGTSFVEAFYGKQVKLVHECTAGKYIRNGSGWWFSPEFLEKHPEAASRFVTALAMARTYMGEHKDEAAAILARKLELKVENLQQPLDLPVFDNPPVIYKYGLRKTAEIMKQYDLLREIPDVDPYVDGRFAKVIDVDY